MRRRRLLQLGAASAVAAALPLPAIASVPAYVDYDLPLEKIFAVNDAFNMLEDYGFSLAEKAGLFGFYSNGIHTMAGLRNITLAWVIDLGSRDTWARVCFLKHIRARLNERLGPDIQAHLEWMDEVGPSPYVNTPRARIEDGDYFSLHNVALRLGGTIDGIKTVFV